MSNSSSSCANYGVSNGSSCACPVGFGGSDCSQPACGGNIFQGPSRSLVPSVGSSFPNISAASCTCQDGWTGEGCNVCQSAGACQAAYSASGSKSSSSAGLGLPDGQNGTLTCNNLARVYAAGQMSCNVQVSTLLPRTSPNVYSSRVEPYASGDIPAVLHFEHYEDPGWLVISSAKYNGIWTKGVDICATFLRRRGTVLLYSELLHTRPRVRRRRLRLDLPKPSMPLFRQLYILRRSTSHGFVQCSQCTLRHPRSLL